MARFDRSIDQEPSDAHGDSRWWQFVDMPASSNFESNTSSESSFLGLCAMDREVLTGACDPHKMLQTESANNNIHQDSKGRMTDDYE